MFSNTSFLRELSPLLVDSTNPTDLLATKFIRKGEASKINVWLGGRYAIPIQPKVFLDGTITVIADSNVVTGSSTTFTDDLCVNDTIQITSTKEVLRVLSIDSNTSFIATSEAVTSKAASTYWVVPDEIVTASEFISAYLLIDFYFAEQASNQEEVEKYIARFDKFVGDIIEQMSKGDYINPDLEEATSSQQSMLPSYSDSSDLRTLIENNDTLFISEAFVR